ncbi:MAG: hypothetical protein CL916_06245 [Deltaproteobacteria bacterium]|nr:hypothetical protein [Deltaproteobacteria bacterium]
MVLIVLFFLCVVSSFLWYYLLDSLLRGVSIEIISLSQPFVAHLGLVVAFGATLLCLYFLIFLVERYREAKIEKRSITNAQLASFLGLQLGVLLRCIMFVRIEVAQKSVYTSDVTLALDDVLLYYWGFGGGLSGAVIVSSILVVLSLLQGEVHEQ